MRLLEFGSTNASAEANTQLSPGLRPNVLGDPESWRRREAIEAALFGNATETISVGRFRLLQRLGEGGMGTVYAAFDDRLDRKIAIKLIRPSQRESAQVRERTLREARALARVSHPNVVHVYEVGEIEEQLFVAMEFLAGPTLRAWLDAQQRPWREVLQIFCQAGEGLAAAHAQGIIHRDFKPHNAMLGADGRVRVLDFGLARLGELELAPTDGAVAGGEGALTMTGAVLGTPAYMAPEQWQAGQAGQTGRASVHSDQFSYCVALFEALYGYRPFAGQTIVQLTENLQAGKVVARPGDTEVPRWVHAVLLRGLSVQANDRWPSMRELLEALARDPGVLRRRVAVGTLLVAFAGVLSYAALRPSEPASEPEVCASAGSEITDVWGDTRAAEVEQTVRAKHGDQADEVLAIALPQINRYADNWSDMRNEACQTHAVGQQSENVFDLRNACLDQRLASLDALVQILVSANTQQLQDAALAVTGLPVIERCADTTALLAAISAHDPEMRERVQLHRETLARAKVHEDSGQPERGLVLVAEVLADAKAIGYEPLVAEAYLHKGCLESWTDAVESERSLSEALWTALATGHAFVAARASSKRGQVTAEKLKLGQQAKGQLPMIMALNRRIVDDPVTYAEYLNDVGTIHVSLLDTREARRWFEAARDVRVARGLPLDWRTLNTRMALGTVTKLENHTLEAVEIFRDIERQVQKIVPSTNAMRITPLANIAEALLEAGRPFEAMAELRRFQTEFALVGGLPSYQRWGLSWQLGRAYRLIGDLPASRTYLSEAQALCPSGPTSWSVAHQLMLTAAAEGDATAVQTYHEQISAQELDHATRMRMVREHARALGRLGAWPEAIVELEKARAMIGDPTERTNAVASWETAFELGRAYRKLGYEAAAERELVRALVELRALYDIEAPPHATALYELGELDLDRQRWSEAREHLEAAESIYAKTAETDYLPRVRTRFALARALTGAAKIASPEARELAQAAIRGLRANAQHDEARVVEAWLEATR